jgi:hypothetical protein
VQTQAVSEQPIAPDSMCGVTEKVIKEGGAKVHVRCHPHNVFKTAVVLVIMHVESVAKCLQGIMVYTLTHIRGDLRDALLEAGASGRGLLTGHTAFDARLSRSCR